MPSKKTKKQSRATESTYLKTLQEACPPESWREVIEKTVEDAKAGDSKARDFLARWLMRDAPELKIIHADELEEYDEIEAELQRREESRLMFNPLLDSIKTGWGK